MSNTAWKYTEAGIAFLEQRQVTPSFFGKTDEAEIDQKTWWGQKSIEERKALRRKYNETQKRRFTPEERKERNRQYAKRYARTEQGKASIARAIKRQVDSGYYIYGKGAIANLKASAELRDIRFSLMQSELESFWKTTENTCQYCKITLKEYMRLRDFVIQYRGDDYKILRFKRSLKTATQQKISRLTLDRKDNCRGYEVGNLAKACWFCNNIKSDFFTAKEMKAMMPRIISQLQQAIRDEETSCFYASASRRPEENAHIQALREVNTTMQQVLTIEQQLLSVILQ